VLANVRVKAVVEMFHGKGSLGGLLGGRDLSSIMKFFPFFIGKFNDVTVGWQENVGRLITLTLLAHVIIN